jgi:hypothetical protein
LQTKKIEETSEEKLKQAFRKQLLLLVAGFQQNEVDEMDVSSMSDEELQEIVRKKLLSVETDDCTKQKAVSVDEVNKYLTHGWEYVANLPNKKIIIKLKE